MKPFFILVILCAAISAESFGQDPEKKLEEMNIVLPVINTPAASFLHAVRTGNLLFLSGKGPADLYGMSVKGKLGQDLSIEEGVDAARLVAINQIAVLKNELGDLKKVKRIVKVLGMVNCKSDFTAHSQVINGFSDLMVEVFGEKGKHARSAIGMCSLPGNIAVEVELIVEVEN